MRRHDRLLGTLAVLGAVSAAPLYGQQAKSGAGGEPPARAGEVDLKYEREFYVYPLESRRDPFQSLEGRTDLGPRFEELTLKGIMYSATSPSMVLLTDASGRIYRLRRGDSVGSARVVNIERERVTFAVNTFGIVRQEQLELKRRPTEGAN